MNQLKLPKASKALENVDKSNSSTKKKLTISHDDPFFNVFLQTKDGTVAQDVELDDTPSYIRAKKLYDKLQTFN